MLALGISGLYLILGLDFKNETMQMISQSFCKMLWPWSVTMEKEK